MPAFILVGITFIVSYVRQESMLEFLRFALALVVAAIPAALPVVLSVTLAVGAMALAKKEAIVSKLVSIEEMASMDILCSDKTGTITQNKPSVADVIPAGKCSDDDVLAYAALASRAEDKDPIDDAILARGKSSKVVTAELKKSKVISFTPFDPVSKRTESRVRQGRGSLLVSKGAPQVILSLSGERKNLDKQVGDFAKKGYRSLGVAIKKQGKWKFTGLIALEDPPRADSAETLKTA